MSDPRTSPAIRFGFVAVLVAATLAPAPAQGQAAPTCFGKEATITGRDAIKGTSGDDVIVGSGDRDFIEGRGGNDRICGGGHNDYITGDWFSCRGEPGRDRLKGDGGEDILWGDSCRAGKGPGARDILRGGPGPDGLAGGPGPDVLFGEDGRDAYFLWAAGKTTVNLAQRKTNGTEGADRLSLIEDVFSRECRKFGDVIIGDRAANRISASEGSDRVRARDGDDRVWSDGKPPNLPEGGMIVGPYCPGGDADRVSGGGGADTISAAEGDDHLSGGPGTDLGRGGPGFDVCRAFERTEKCES